MTTESETSSVTSNVTTSLTSSVTTSVNYSTLKQSEIPDMQWDDQLAGPPPLTSVSPDSSPPTSPV